MRKFSVRRKMQPTPPVCKGVPPAKIPAVPPPGDNAQASVTYIGPTSGAPIDASGQIPLTLDGVYPHYTGETTTAAGVHLVLSGTITHAPPSTSLTLVGQAANGDFFSALGSSDQIAYNPWLTSQAIVLVPANPGATATITLAQ